MSQLIKSLAVVSIDANDDYLNHAIKNGVSNNPRYMARCIVWQLARKHQTDINPPPPPDNMATIRADDIFKYVFLNENAKIRFQFHWSLLQTGDKP